MTSQATPQAAALQPGTDWGLWKEQVRSILRMETAKHFLSRRGWWIYGLAFAPALLFGLHAVFMAQRGRVCNTGVDTIAFSVMFQFFFLRLAVFFGCVGIFMNLFRGDVLDKSLHYYFLAPVRREVLVVGKYLSGLTVAIALFGGGALLSLIIFYGHFGVDRAQQMLFESGGYRQALPYLGVTVLACAGYGAVFTIMGQKFKNPMIPAAAVLIWEGLNPFLPSLLKKVSVVFYLRSLLPLDAPVRGPFAMLVVGAEPMPAWASIGGLLALTAAAVGLACVRARTMEISYGSE
jgi:ABC-type transport system involved in multi-copper enzyme maturation permease subunit